MPAEVAVVGAGISGLACAHRLKQLGFSVAIFEAEEHAGGVIRTLRHNGYLIEKGPQSFLGTELVLELVKSLGIEDKLVSADPRAPRYVLQRGRLRAVPMSPQAILTSSLLGAGSRWRIFSEPFRKTSPPMAEESVAQFVRRKFGHEILEYLVTPFVSGVYAGDPEMLSLKSAFPSLDEWERKYGSVLRGAMKSRPAGAKLRPSLCTFGEGNSTLLDALAAQFGDALRRGAKVEQIVQTSAGPSSEFAISFTKQGKVSVEEATSVALATPAYVSGHLLAGFSNVLRTRLAGIAYAPVAVVALGYRATQVRHPIHGFGFLIPRKENRRTLGTVWNSSLFPARAPQGRVLLTSFVGGATDPEIVAQPEEFVATVVRHDIEPVLRITGPPEEQFVWRWRRALPQYNLGHAQNLAEICDELTRLPGIFLTGNYLAGPSIGDCIAQAHRTAEAVHSFLKREAA